MTTKIGNFFYLTQKNVPKFRKENPIQKSEENMFILWLPLISKQIENLQKKLIRWLKAGLKDGLNWFALF